MEDGEKYITLFTISVRTIDVLSGCKYQYWPRNGNCSKYILWRGDQMMFRPALMLHINILSLDTTHFSETRRVNVLLDTRISGHKSSNS